MSRSHIPGMAAPRNTDHELQNPFSSKTAAPPSFISSPPGLNTTIQSITSNSTAHSLNMIPGLAFGSPPAPSQHRQLALAHYQLPQTLPDVERKQINGAIQPDRASLPARVPVPHTPEISKHPVELSEGEFEEFEDLYEPKDGSEGSQAAAATATTNGCASVGEADGSSLYDNNTPRLDTAADNMRRTSSADEDWEPTLDPLDSLQSRLPRLDAVTTQVSPAVPQRILPQSHPAQAIAEAKKKAQEAILALWPLKVRYQNYIDEGFDENVVNALFKELGLDTPTAKASHGTAPIVGDAESGPNATSSAPNTKNQEANTSMGKPGASSQPAHSASVGSVLGDDKQPQPRSTKSAAEERKDKIARKLAAKSQRPVTAVTVSAPQTPKVTIATPAKPKTRAETNALLHQKLAALKKSQEKAAADRLAAQAAVARKDSIAPAIEISQQLESEHSPIPTPPVSTFTPARQFSEPASGAQVKIGETPVATSITPGGGPSRTLKRPVASDFDSYPSYPDGGLKRTRTQDTLIIDISDEEEEEDDDVEMEIGSPADEPTETPASYNDSALATTRDLHETQSGQPAVQPGTERASTAPAPESRGKLHLLRGKIEEIRRRIAEAESKKTGKTPVETEPSSPRSPRAHSDAMGVAQPKISALRRESEEHSHSRDGRVVSVELLLVESDLQTKQEKLKAIVAEAARLELEIQNALAQKKKLASEMEGLDITPDSGQMTASHLQSPLEDVEPMGQSFSAESTNPHSIDLEEAQGVPTERVGQATFATQAEAISGDDIALNNDDEPLGEDLPVSSTTQLQRVDISIGEAKPAGLQENPTSMDISTEEEHDDTDEDDDVSMGADDNDDDGERSARDQSVQTTTEHSLQIKPDLEENRATSPEAQISPQVGVVSAPQTQGHESAAASPSNSSGDERLKDDMAVGAGHTHEPEAQQVASLGKFNQHNVHKATTKPPYQPNDKSRTATQSDGHIDQDSEIFTSYHSPLEYFHAYRFHPSFLDNVHGGLKSLTYSSKINVEQMLCPLESDEQECQDPECEYQHFKKMVLPDGDIITQLGSADMFSGETKTQFIAGLRKTLQELKVNKVKDFDRITKAIVQYRAEFLADKSKVLPLYGVQL